MSNSTYYCHFSTNTIRTPSSLIPFPMEYVIGFMESQCVFHILGASIKILLFFSLQKHSHLSRTLVGITFSVGDSANTGPLLTTVYARKKSSQYIIFLKHSHLHSFKLSCLSLSQFGTNAVVSIMRKHELKIIQLKIPG